VCGASLPLDFTRALPFHCHGDVLAFHTPGSPTDSAAGLSIGRGGETLLELRAAARLPGRPAEAVRGLRVRHPETEVRQDRRGKDFLAPVRWPGELRRPHGRFRREARAATPLADILPAGGMLGFDFSGAWSAPGGGRREWEGTGFCEHGDFSGKLAGRTSPGEGAPKRDMPRKRTCTPAPKRRLCRRRCRAAVKTKGPGVPGPGPPARRFSGAARLAAPPDQRPSGARTSRSPRRAGCSAASRPGNLAPPAPSRRPFRLAWKPSPSTSSPRAL